MTERLIALGDRFEIYAIPSGFRVLRRADLAEIRYEGDDRCEHFDRLFDGDSGSEADPIENADDADRAGERMAGEFPELSPLKRWSLILNWHNHDHEQGTFGTTVDACDPDAAERLARWKMWETYNAQYEAGEPAPDDIADCYGDVIECSDAPIFDAGDLRDALADLVEWNARMGGFDNPVWDRAKAVLERTRATPA